MVSELRHVCDYIALVEQQRLSSNRARVPVRHEKPLDLIPVRYTYLPHRLMLLIQNEPLPASTGPRF